MNANNQIHPAEIHEDEARSLVSDIVCSTDYSNPDGLLQLLIRLDGLETHNDIKNALDFLISAAFSRSRVCQTACDAYRTEAVARQEAVV